MFHLRGLAITPYLAGLSLRAITERYGLVEASEEAARLWVEALKTYHGPEACSVDEMKFDGE